MYTFIFRYTHFIL